MGFEAIHTLAARTAQRLPDHVAVTGPTGSHTFAELAARADDIAAALRDAGVSAGTPVAILAADRAELAAALLAVLRAGALAVPLDPTAAPSRLATMVGNSGAQMALVGTDTTVPPATVGSHVPILDIPATSGRRAGGVPAAHPSEHDDPCSIFFTSGSTGTPKGIVGRLGGIDHFVRWEIETLGVTADWRVAQVVSPAFDAVLRELFVPLVTGAVACVPPASARLDPAELATWIDTERIDLVHTVPSVFRRLLDAAEVGGLEFRSLRCVALSGEKLSPKDARRWFDLVGDRVQLLNLYGPTETTMTKTFHFVRPADADRPSIPVGVPLPGTDVLLLDGHGTEVPAGSVGEIHLRTAQRSLGYLGLADATALAFVPGPRGPSDIVYRTGDFGRFDPDGLLEFLGRKDDQVKIGGVRVELGGVEAVLREHPAVTDVAVVHVDADDEPPYLCAFVELVSEVESSELRQHVRTALPDSAVPALVVSVDELPRTLSGKIDRAALRVPVRTRETANRGTAPRTPTEQTVARIWAAVLRTEFVDVEANFFERGGGSMTVIELLSRLGTEFGVPVTLHEFLAAPTVAAVADRVERALLDSDAELDDLLDTHDTMTATTSGDQE